MKHLSLLFLAALLAVAVPAPSARADVSVSVDFFFDALSPYGDWIYAQDYGYVWQPAQAQHDDWAPYSDGYWAYTDAGWTWISNEEYGWATYHYGRWIRMHGHWVWVPGNEWAPAWVSWRQTNDYVGWAPLPPEARWSINIGFNQWSDSYYDVGPGCYNFVPMRWLGSRSSLRSYIVDRSRNVTYINNSVNITNISYQQNVVNNIFVGGPDPARIDRFGESPVRRLSLRRDEESFRREWIDNRGERPGGFGSLSRIERGQLVVAAPTVRNEGAPGLPPRVRERFDRPDIDRGWKGAGDSKAIEHLRERQREEFAKAKPDKLPEQVPQLITSTVPPPAIGRLLKPDERRGGLQRPDPRRIEEEVRKAEPFTGNRGTPGRVTEQPPAPGDARRSGMPDRDGLPGKGPITRPDSDGRMPSIIPGGLPGVVTPGNEPGSKGDRPGRPPGFKPGETPRSRLTPGIVPEEPGDRRRGAVPNKPGMDPTKKVEDQPPGAKPSVEPKLPLPPKATPVLPKVIPDMPGREGRPGRTPDVRRPSVPESPPSLPKVKPVPMPAPEVKPQARPSPMPRPEAPKVKPAPMPQAPMYRPAPEQRPVPERKVIPSVRSIPQERNIAPPQRVAPQIKIMPPQVRPAPQVRQVAPPSRPMPQVRQAPPPPRPVPQVRQLPPQVVRPVPVPQARPAAPAPQRAAPGEKPDERRRR